MDRNLASILALAGTAAVSVTLAAIAPGDAYADDAVARTQTQYNHLPPARSAASIEDLKRLYLECDRASIAQRLAPAEVMLCSTVYEALKRHAFDGDFDRLLAWSRANATQRSGER
jgi:hypothetical protein